MASPALASTRSRCPHQFAHSEVVNQPYFVFFDARGRWLHVGPKVAELLGYPEEELVGSTAERFMPPGLDYFPRMLLQFLDDGYQDSVFALRRRDGRNVGVRAEAWALPDGCNVAVWNPI